MVRLEFLKYMATLTAMWRVNPIPGKIFIDSDFTKADFGKDFSWGVATSAYQIEGTWNADGKGESVWDRFTSKQRNVKDKTTGNEAIDFYNRSESDLKLLKSRNFENFRFSFSWSRILPDGTGKINEKGIDFYNKIIDTCLELGIEPWRCFITGIYHRNSRIVEVGQTAILLIGSRSTAKSVHVGLATEYAIGWY